MTTIPETMKAAVLIGPNQLEIKNVPTPKPGPMEVLLKVETCACCSTDVALMNKPLPGQPPYGDFIPGHEYAGTVSAVGETVDEVNVGDRVAVRRTPNTAWVAALGLEAFWTASGYEIDHERILTAVDPVTNRVTVDIPLVDAMAHWLGGGEIQLLDAGARIRQVGVEDLRLESDYNGAEDEDHANTAVELSAVEDAWVQRITALYFGNEG